jgi:hypothetical protein
MRNCARTLGEWDFIVLGLFSVPKCYQSKNREREGTWSCQEGGDIADGDDDYAVGNNGNNKPLAEGNNGDDNESINTVMG